MHIHYVQMLVHAFVRNAEPTKRKQIHTDKGRKTQTEQLNFVVWRRLRRGVKQKREKIDKKKLCV